MKKNISKILLALTLLPTVGFAAYNGQNYSNTQKISRYKIDYSYKDRVQNRTEVKNFSFSNVNRVKLEVDVEGIDGSISFKVVEDGGKVVFRADNPYEFERYIELNSSKNYKLVVELKNFTGKYEFDLESQ